MGLGSSAPRSAALSLSEPKATPPPALSAPVATTTTPPTSSRSPPRAPAPPAVTSADPPRPSLPSVAASSAAPSPTGTSASTGAFLDARSPSSPALSVSLRRGATSASCRLSRAALAAVVTALLTYATIKANSACLSGPVMAHLYPARSGPILVHAASMGARISASVTHRGSIVRYNARYASRLATATGRRRYLQRLSSAIRWATSQELARRRARGSWRARGRRF
jgi:hypothetical protein